MTEFYADGQLRRVARLMRNDPPPLWLVLCGPADGNEAQTAVAEWPGVRVFGVEPNRHAVEFQLANGWPEGSPLLWGAAMDRDGTCQFGGIAADDLRHGRAIEGQDGDVRCWRLDDLDAEHGPLFERALLWADVEGSEAAVLRGAEGLLVRGAFWWVSIETDDRLPKVKAEAEGILRRHGFEPAGTWRVSGGAYNDTLWRLKDEKRS